MKKSLKFNLHEFSGSLGDIGVFLPLAIGLIRFNNLNPTSVFLGAGLLYIIAGFYFKIPMPVEPLKATSVIAIAIGASAMQISTTAVIMGVIFIIIAYSKLGDMISKIFPRPIVRGVQLSLGLLLVKKAIELFISQVFHTKGMTISLLGNNVSVVSLSLILGSIAVFIILVSRNNNRIPSAFILSLIGGIVAFLALISNSNHILLGYTNPQLINFNFSLDNLYTVFFILLLPQIPLTFANSIVATKDTAKIYFPGKSQKVTIKALCTSVGAANILAGIIGGMPMCHGSNGITAHYRFGARTLRSNLFIGSMFVVIALVFGKIAAGFFSFFPISILSVMLIYIGIEHSRLIRDILKIPGEIFICLTIAAISLVSGDLAIGFGSGIALNLIMNNWVKRKKNLEIREMNSKIEL